TCCFAHTVSFCCRDFCARRLQMPKPGPEHKRLDYFAGDCPVYCFDLLWRLTFSAVRRIRFLMSACSLRARFSVSPTTTSVAPIRKATSASANQRAPSFELMGTTPRVPRSSGGKVGRGAEVVGFFTNR